MQKGGGTLCSRLVLNFYCQIPTGVVIRDEAALRGYVRH